jgi:hypothetical protein
MIGAQMPWPASKQQGKQKLSVFRTIPSNGNTLYDRNHGPMADAWKVILIFMTAAVLYQAALLDAFQGAHCNQHKIFHIFGEKVSEHHVCT